MADMIAPIEGKVRVCASGTPAKSRPVELFTQLNYLAPVEFPNFFAFAKRYCDARKGAFGWDFSGASNLDELNSRLRSTIMIRRMKSEVLKDLGLKTRQVISLQPDSKMQKLIKREFEAYEAEKVERAAGRLGVAATELASLRVLIGEQKVKHVAAHLEEVNEPTIVFVRHKSVQKALREALEKQGKRVVIYNGDMNITAKKASENAFQDGDADVFIGTITACGIGLTLTRASYEVFAEIEWTPSDLTQAEDRAYRQGQTKNVLVHHIVFDGSLDDHMLATIIRKQRVLDKAIDGDVHVERTVEAEYDEGVGGGSHDDLINEYLKIKNGEKEEARKPRTEGEVPTEQKEAILECMRALSGACDGARTWDGAGFSKFDARFGHDIARRHSLTDGQARAAKKLVVKYRRQLQGHPAFAVAAPDQSTEA